MDSSSLMPDKMTDGIAASEFNVEDTPSTTPLVESTCDDNDEIIIEERIHVDRHNDPKGDNGGNQRDRTQKQELHKEPTSKDSDKREEHTMQSDHNNKNDILGPDLARKHGINGEETSKPEKPQRGDTFNKDLHLKTVSGPKAIPNTSHLQKAAPPKTISSSDESSPSAPVKDPVAANIVPAALLRSENHTKAVYKESSLQTVTKRNEPSTVAVSKLVSQSNNSSVQPESHLEKFRSHNSSSNNEGAIATSPPKTSSSKTTNSTITAPSAAFKSPTSQNVGSSGSRNKRKAKGMPYKRSKERKRKRDAPAPSNSQTSGDSSASSTFSSEHIERKITNSQTATNDSSESPANPSIGLTAPTAGTSTQCRTFALHVENVLTAKREWNVPYLEKDVLPEYVSQGLVISEMPIMSPFVQILVPVHPDSYPRKGMATFKQWAAKWKKDFQDYTLGVDLEGYYVFFKPHKEGEKSCTEFNKWTKGQKVFGIEPEFVLVGMKESRLIKASLVVDPEKFMPQGSCLSRLNNVEDCGTEKKDFVFVKRQKGWRPTQQDLQSLWEHILTTSPSTAREVERVRVDAWYFIILFKNSSIGSDAAKKCITRCFSGGWKTFDQRDFVLIDRSRLR